MKTPLKMNFCSPVKQYDCLCGLVVRVLGYSRRPGFDSRHYQIFWGEGGGGKKKEKETVVGLERGPLSLVSTTELLRKVAAPV
jgi:hypothetical protein